MNSFVGLGVILAIFCCFINTEAHKEGFEDCGSKGVNVTNVDLTPCSTDPCQVFPGKSSAIAVSFEALKTASNITAKVYGIIAGVKLPYSIPQPEACTKSNLTCPLKPNTDYVYSVSLKLPKGLPKVNVIVELDMIVDSSTYLCIQFPVVVTPTGEMKYQPVLDDVQLILD